MQRRMLLSSAVTLAGVSVLPETARAQVPPNVGLSVENAVGLVRGITSTSFDRQFQGTVQITEFFYDGQLGVKGFISGIVQGPGGSVPITNRPFRQYAVLVQRAGAAPATAQKQVCPILDLDIGPIFLNLLGLVIDLSEINLNIFALPGPGALLGNLLCALVGLLDDFALGGGLRNLLRDILNLIEEINDLLADFRIPPA